MSLEMPEPTRDLEQAKEDLRVYGLAVVRDALTPAQHTRTRDALYRASDDDRERGREVTGFALDRDGRNQRIWHLLSRDPIFCDLAEHPVAIELVRFVLGWPALLSNISGNVSNPGASAGVLHADQIFVPEPWPSAPQGFNLAWCVDDFTEANGATQVVPGSHHWHRPPRAEDQDAEAVPVAAPAGSALVFESRVWHRAGINTSAEQRRAGIFAFYTTPIYRTQENWFLSLDPAVRRFASDTLKALLAFRTSGFGLVYGESPE